MDALRFSPRAAGACAVLLLVLAGGCATPGDRQEPAAASAEEQVQQRALERWEHLVARRFREAWAYLSPGIRSARPVDRYESEMSLRPVRWTRVEPLGATCETDPAVCTVRVKVWYQVRSHLTSVGMVGADSEVSEQWILSGGQWVHVPEDLVSR